MAGWLWSSVEQVRKEALAAEAALLDSVAWDGASYSLLDVPVKSPASDTTGLPHAIHTIVAQKAVKSETLATSVGAAASVGFTAHPPGEGGSCPIVLWHGFGQGAASWWRNLPGLARAHSGPVYSLDWLGVGLSTRPTWPANGQDPAVAEAFFADSLEEWRQEMGIERMHLVAHSLSAFFAVRYAEQHPERLESLVLMSPAGVPEGPEGGLRAKLSEMPWGARKALFSTVGSVWEAGATPQGVVRSLGEWVGKGFFIDGYVFRRFRDDVPNKPEFAEYMYRHWQGPSSGEQAISALLQPGAFAIAALGPQRIPSLPPDLPLAFVYGSTDWMDIGAAHSVANAIDALKQTTGASSSARSSSSNHPRFVSVEQMPQSGHQLFIENPEGVNEAILRMCRPRSVLYAKAHSHTLRRANSTTASASPSVAAAAAAAERPQHLEGDPSVPAQIAK